MVDSVCIFELLPLDFASEPFFLHSRHVKHVRVSKDLVKRLALMHRHTSLASCRNDRRRYRQRWRGNEVESDGVEAQKGDEAVDRSTVFQISQKRDSSSVHRPKLRSYRVHV